MPSSDRVNASQSTNDVYPTAVRLALWMAIDRLLGSMEILRAGFDAKAVEFKSALKIGRTQLQDAVPMTLGQEFSTYAVMIEEDLLRLTEARALIQEINLGATAITRVRTDHGLELVQKCSALEQRVFDAATQLRRGDRA